MEINIPACGIGQTIDPFFNLVFCCAKLKYCVRVRIKCVMK